MAALERAMVVSYRFSIIVTVALSVTIRSQFAFCDWMSPNAQINRGWVIFGQNFRAFVPLGADPSCLGLQRANIPG